MGVISKLVGIVGNLFQVGKGGPQLKNNSGVLEIRNSTDTGFAVMRAGTPVGVNDAVPKSYADLVAHIPNLDAPQYAGMFTSHISTLRGPSLAAGGTYTVLDIDGAGYLSKIFCTLAGYTGGAPSIKFQVYVDGETSPSIDVFVEDMCCFRSGTCSSDRAGGGIGSNGLSFFFNFVAPFNSHVKVMFVDQLNSGAHLLGGYLEYKIGTGMNWGLYGKLWSSTMNYTVVPYATQNILNISSATGGVFIGGYYDMTGQADFHYLEGWMNAVIDGGTGSTNWINGGGGQIATGNYMFDSVEDYGEDGFYFGATGNAHNQTRNVGITFNPSSGHIAWYKWHYENPMVFSSTFVWEFMNGWNGSFPTSSNTTVKGVVWYYTGAVGSVVSPTTIKGDQGVPGAQGNPGTPAAGAIVRYTPVDSNTLLAWKFSEAGSPFASTGTNSQTMTTKTGTPIFNAPGLFGSAVDNTASAQFWTGNSTVEPTGDSCTLSCWVFLWNQTGTFGGIVTKEYRNDGTHNSPYTAMNFQWNSAADGTWSGIVTVGGVNSGATSGSNRVPLYQWTHLALTYDGTTLRLYQNGILVNTRLVSGTVDYGTHGPWVVNGYVTGGTLTNGMIIDVRVESTVRSASYLRQLYCNAFGMNP